MDIHSTIYRPAELNDCGGIRAISLMWYEAYRGGFKEKGFVRYQFTVDELQRLIIAKEVVIAEYESNIVGYYLINSIYEKEVVVRRRQYIEALIVRNELSAARYVCHCQAAIDSNHIGKGIGKRLLKTLKQLVSDRFDFLVSGIAKDNLYAIEVQIKAGWKIVADREDELLVLTPTHDYL